MIFRCRYAMMDPRHVRCSLYAGPHEGALAKCGDLVMRPEEFDHFAWLARGRFEFDPPTRFVREPAAARVNGVTARILDQVRRRLTTAEYRTIFWVITTALDDAFDQGVIAAGGAVVEDGSPRGYKPVQLPEHVEAAVVAADWFALPPRERTKARLIEMLDLGGLRQEMLGEGREPEERR